MIKKIQIARAQIVRTAIAVSTVASLFVAATAQAQGNSEFGLGLPENISDLPAGQFRQALEALPPRAQGRALGLLQGGIFPAADFEVLHVNDDGDLFYVDPVMESEGAEEEPAPAGGATLSQVFVLHSQHGASTILYLDFDGHVLKDTAWNGYSGQTALYAKTYSRDSDHNAYSQTELDYIAESWRRVAEDFAPFDIDVTTEEPPFNFNSSTGRIEYGSHVGHILITDQTDENGYYLYSQGGCGCGGVAYYNGFGSARLSPGLVFNTSLNGVSEAISHEFGHNLNLTHDGQSPGDGAYYWGHGSGAMGWGPIMGASYNVNMTQWSKGEYLDSNNSQDDLAVIASQLSYDVDDHADTIGAGPTDLILTGDVDVISIGRVSDPTGSDPYNRGFIEDPFDKDVFHLDVGAGTIVLDISAAHLETHVSGTRSNLNIQARLLDATGAELLVSDLANDTDAAINYVVTIPGDYYLEIDGVGFGDAYGTGFSGYGSIGEYFINGTVPSPVLITSAPTAPASVTATLVDDVNIHLTWTDPATPAEADESGYYVWRKYEDGPFVNYRTLARDSEFLADNNVANGEYTYYLEVFNVMGVADSPDSNTTLVDAPTVVVATSENTTFGSVESGSYASTQVTAGSETVREQHSGGKPRNRTSYLDHSWYVTGVIPGNTVELYVMATAPSNTEGDDFAFYYDLGDGVLHHLGTVLAGLASQEALTGSLPASTSGTVEINVIDTGENLAGSKNTDSVTVQEIRITSTGDPAEQDPVVTITDPADNITVAGGTLLEFHGTASDFEDGDRTSLISWSTDQSQGYIGSGASASVTLDGGTPAVTHVITASVQDTVGNISIDQITVIVDDTPAALSVAISDLDGTVAPTGRGGKWSATVDVEVQDNLGALIDGVTVSGTWSAGGASSCVTGNAGVQGRCKVTKGGLKSNAGSVTYSVTSITGGLPYDPADNVDLDGDSTGSAITLLKP